MKNELLFDYGEIREKGGLKTSLKLEGSLFKDSVTEPSVLKDAEVSLSFSVGSDSLLLEGSVRARLNFVCSRCAKTFEGYIEEDFDEVYENPEEPIDLTSLVGESITLAEPLKPLCSENCEGFKEVKNSEDFKKTVDNPFKISKNINFEAKTAKKRGERG